MLKIAVFSPRRRSFKLGLAACLVVPALTLVSTFAACGGDSAPNPVNSGASTSGTTNTTGSGGSGGKGASTTGNGGDGSTTGNGGGNTGTGGVGDAGTGATIDFVPIDQIVDLTPDGKIALLQDINSPNDDVYFYDTTTKVLTMKTSTGDFNHPATGIAAGGSRISAFHGTPIQAGLWSEAAGWTDLGNIYDAGCDPAESSAFDLSADGLVTVGLVWNGCNTEAFRWTGGVFTKLQSLGMGSSRATKISDDGKVSGGFAQVPMADRTPAVWQADGTGILLDPTEQVVGEVLSVSADGSVVAGTWDFDGFYWTKAEGVVDIGKLASALPNDPTFVNAISAGGKLMFGGCGDVFNGIEQAIVWTKAGGMVTLQDIATKNGAAIPAGYTLTDILAASTDGSILLGAALDDSPNPQPKSFVLKMPISAYDPPSP